MARLPYPDRDGLPREVADTLAMAPDLNIFRMLGHCETLMRPFLFLGGAILTQTRIDPLLRELAIVRAAVHCGSAYELNQHDEIAREVGVTQEQLDALREFPLPASDLFEERQRAVVRFADEVVRNVKASDEAFAALGFLDHCEIQELILAIGYYSMVGRFLETLEVELETGAERAFVKVAEVGRTRA